jgi:nitrite reductase (NO-forming)/hydroxylamine reductase
VFDGATLEAKYVGSVLPKGDSKVNQVRVGSVVASKTDPIWAMTLMESGKVGIVDYKQTDFPLVASIDTAPGILDGGLDHSGRYFIVPASEKNELVVVDLKDRKKVGTIATGERPHPGEGANWQDPKAGWVNATPHIGEGKLLVYGADPKDAPQRAWKKIRDITGLAAGGLNVRTHPSSPWVWVDSPANRKPELARQVCVISKKSGKLEKCWQPRQNGRVLDFAYNADGTEVWVSGWNKPGSIIVYDDATLKEVQRIEGDWVVTPTSKFNVTNIAGDVY